MYAVGADIGHGVDAVMPVQVDEPLKLALVTVATPPVIETAKVASHGAWLPR